MKIAIAGDWTYQNYKKLDHDILNLFSSSDYVIYNFETAIDFGGEKIEKAYNFSLKEKENIFINKNTICHLANNHLNDLGMKNAYKTIEYIKGKGYCIGIISKTLKIEPYVLLKNKNETVAVLGCAEMKCENNDFSFLHYRSDNFFLILEKLHKLTDKVIISIHWGDEQNFVPSPKQRRFAKQCMNNHTSLFIGHHSHIFQPYEKYKNNFIFYSIGNFQIPVTASTNSIGQKYSNILIFDSSINKIDFNPIYISNSNPILLKNKKIKLFYENFNAKYISSFKYFLFSLSYHYSQNWEAWKIRFKRYGSKELFQFFKFICRPKNCIGMLNYVFFYKITKKHSPLGFIKERSK